MAVIIATSIASNVQTLAIASSPVYTQQTLATLYYNLCM